MAQATVTIKTTPPELKVICDALKMYADVMSAVARGEQKNLATFCKGVDPRREVHAANFIREKIGY